jgi:hypothetical protein
VLNDAWQTYINSSVLSSEYLSDEQCSPTQMCIQSSAAGCIIQLLV